MDEATVSSLIAEGEGRNIEFKRELDLDSARGKSEFIKDLISLANSALDTGYLIIGVADDARVVGTGDLQGERIQQIVHTYIDPPVNLRCTMIVLHTLAPMPIGVIEISATSKPHKVARAIDRLNKDEVFVRHGSVVTRAGPEEIIRLSRWTF